MNWRDWMYVDMVELLSGRVRTTTPRPWTNIRHSGSLTLHVLGMPFRALASFLPRKIRDRIVVITQLARIVACNAPLDQGIAALLDDAPRLRIARVLANLRADIEAGLSLSEAMRRQPKFFPRHYVDLIQSGERSGTLYDALQEVAADMNDRVQARDAVRGCLAYWSLLFLLGSAALLFYFVKILPVFVSILRDFGGGLPGPTRLLIYLADDMKSEPLLNVVVGSLLAIVVIVIRRLLSRAMQKRTPIGMAYARMIAAIPFFGGLWAQAHLAQAASILRRLLNAGYPLDEALESTAASDIAPPFAASLLRLRDRVREGQTLGHAVESEAFLLPASFRGLVAVGESSGRLAEALEELSYLYRQRVLKAVRISADLMFPLGVFAMGALVFLIATSTFSLTTSIVDTMMGNM